jgi:hypothetical protein
MPATSTRQASPLWNFFDDRRELSVRLSGLTPMEVRPESLTDLEIRLSCHGSGR